MNRRRILLILARLIAFAAIAEAMTVWLFWRSTWTPIERHYLPAYIWCSLPVISPATVEVQWIWKTGRHRKHQLATDNDTVASEDGTGMVLSQSARDVGWKVLIEGPRQQVPADVLSPDLASLAFERQSLWDLLLLPELSTLAALCAALGVWSLLIGFFRALLSEIAWRRRYFAFWEWPASFFEECAALARGVHSGLAALRRSPDRRMAMQGPATRTEIVQSAPSACPPSFAFPLFGVHNGTGGGYLWSERDEID